MPILLDKPEPGENARRGPRRLWTVPLAPTLAAGAFDGYALLEELRGDALPLLFHFYRDALLWALVDPEDREHLFRGSVALPAWTDVPASLSQALAQFQKLGTHPSHVDATELAHVCLSVAEWAALGGHGETEYHFADLAARVAPTDPNLAFNAGRAARRHARTEDSRSWFRRTVALARRADDEAAYANAYLGWGILEERQGNIERARRQFVRAWRAAKRGKLKELAAAARHNMVTIAFADRNFARGQAHIMRAYKLYGRSNPQLHRLANDAATFWFGFGFFGLALPLFEASLPQFTREDERALVLANISRAAAAVGDRERYLEARDQTLELNRELRDSLPETYIELALGAHALRYTASAKTLASKAVEVSRKRWDAAMVARAESVVDAINRGAELDRAREPDPEMARFAAHFLARLRELG